MGEPATELFLLMSSAEFVETVTGESPVSGKVSVTVGVSGLVSSAEASPFTIEGAEGSGGSGLASGCG